MDDIARLGIEVDSRSVGKATDNLDDMTKASERTEKSVTSFTKKSKSNFLSLAKSIGLFTIATAAITGGLSRGVNSASRFQTELVGVAKTTGLAGRELEDFASRIDGISTRIPVSTSELLRLSQAAGQMGVTGSANLEKFSLTIAKLGRASDLAGEEAATALARILNVTGESVDTVDVLASVIVSLGNNVAATESQIARMTTEVARATSIFDVTSAQAAAMGAAMASIGVQAELGGSSVGRVMQEITSRVQEGGASLRDFAGTLNLNADTLTTLFQDDKVAALELFLESVGSLGLDAGDALKAVGLGGQEIFKTIVPLSKNMSIFRETLALANAEVVNATALDREFEASLATLGSQWQVTKNIMESYAISIGNTLVPALNEGLLALNKFFGAGEEEDIVRKQVRLIEELDEKIKSLKTRNIGLDGVVPGASRLFGTNKREIDELESSLENYIEDLFKMVDAQALASGESKKLGETIADIRPGSAIDAVTGGKKGIDLAKRFIDSLKEEQAQLGKTEKQIRKMEAANLGVSKTADPLIDSIFKTNEGLEKQAEIAQALEEDLRKIESITQSVATAEEKFIETQTELNRLLGSGLSIESYNRAIGKAKDEMEGLGKTSKSVFGDINQFTIQAARNIHTSLADALLESRNGFKSFFNSIFNSFKNLIAQIASQKILSTIFSGGSGLNLGNLFSGSSGGSGGGFGLLDGFNVLSTAKTAYQAFTTGIANTITSNLSSAASFAGDLFGVTAASSLGSALGGASTAGSFGPAGAGFLSGGQGAAVATEFSAAQIAGAQIAKTTGSTAGGAVAGGSSAGTAATGFGLLALATQIGNQLVANNKEIGGRTADELNSLKTTFESFEGFAGSIISLGTGRTLTDLVGKLGGPFKFAADTINSFIPNLSSLTTALFGLGRPKLKQTNLIGQVTSDGFSGVASAKIKREGGAFRKDRVQRVIIDADSLELTGESTSKFSEFADSLRPQIELLNFTLDGAIALLNDSVTRTSEKLGLGSTAGFSTNINIASEKGEFFNETQITQELQRIEVEFIKHVVPGIELLVREGETVVTAFQRIGFEFDAIVGIGNNLGLRS